MQKFNDDVQLSANNNDTPSKCGGDTEFDLLGSLDEAAIEEVNAEMEAEKGQ